MSQILAAAKVATLPSLSVGHSLLQMAIALAAVVASIWGLSKVLARLRRGAATTARRRSVPGGLSIVSRQSLGKDLAIATVRWGEREVLVGIAGSTITFLDDTKGTQPASRPRAGTGEPDQPDGETDGETGDPDGLRLLPPMQGRSADALFAQHARSRRVAAQAGASRGQGEPGRGTRRAGPGNPASRPAQAAGHHSLIDALRDATARR